MAFYEIGNYRGGGGDLSAPKEIFPPAMALERTVDINRITLVAIVIWTALALVGLMVLTNNDADLATCQQRSSFDTCHAAVVG